MRTKSTSRRIKKIRKAYNIAYPKPFCFEIKYTPISIGTRKLKAKWSFEFVDETIYPIVKKPTIDEIIEAIERSGL